jgi:hypothetical protein
MKKHILKWFYEISRFRIFIIAASIPVLFFSYGVSCDPLADEATEIASASAENWQSGAAFVVHVFGGYVTVPNRYQVNFNSDKDSYDLEFFSPNAFLRKRRDVLAWPVGEISVGRLDNLPKGHPLASGEPIEEFNCYGLEVEVRDFQIKGEHFVIFKKDEQYLTIADGNDALWKGMLVGYARSIGSSDACPEVAGVGSP